MRGLDPEAGAEQRPGLDAAAAGQLEPRPHRSDAAGAKRGCPQGQAGAGRLSGVGPGLARD
ncbi:hypothetical protein [Nannocystis pusilla]|uniref:hypothetical protein n=1 Tax=Nannocystis pusilla TaxID=889268 RepID=UPI003B776A65